MALKIGLIGLEGHQGVILDGLAERPDLVLAAVASENERACAYLRTLPAAQRSKTRFFPDWREMLKLEELDLVGVCNPDGERAPVLLALAERGLHIISEKPLVSTLVELEEVRAALKRSKGSISMLLTMRWAPAYQAVKRLVQEGALGEVVAASAQKSYRLGERPGWMKSRKTFSGTIPYIGIHMLDLIRWTSGREYLRVAALSSNVSQPQVGQMEDNSALLLELDNRGSATIRLDYLRPPKAPTHGDDRLRLAGSRGVVEVTGNGERVTLITDQEPPRELPLTPAETPYFQDFLESLQGKRRHLLPPEDIFRITEVALLAREAAERKEIISLAR